MQTIIAYIIIGVAVGYTIYSVVKALSRKNVPSCGGSCEGCKLKEMKNVQCTMNNCKDVACCVQVYNEEL